MADADTVDETLAEAAGGGIAKATLDGTTIEGYPLTDLIEAAKYLRQRDAAAKNHLGLTIRRLEPGECG